MRLKNIITNIALAALCVAPMSSCSDWLEVDMEDGIMENTLFEDNEGFLVALNGIYTNLNGVYSSFLGMGAIDVMAQYYNVQQNSQHPYYVYANYNYTDDTFDQASGSLWTNMYTLIANTNLLLDHCDEEGSAISPRYYDMVKGEALALRAMMHFDMLRLYGPIYSETTASQSAIPYLETANNREMLPILPASEVAQKVMRDLNEASSLLQNDSIRTAGVNSSESEDINENNDFRYRQYRLNYFAVQTLLARLHLWMGNKSEAYGREGDLPLGIGRHGNQCVLSRPGVLHGSYLRTIQHQPPELVRRLVQQRFGRQRLDLCRRHLLERRFQGKCFLWRGQQHGLSPQNVGNCDLRGYLG